MPRAVHAGRGTGARVRWCDARAADAGVRPGQTLAAARARCAALDSRLLDPGALARARREVIAALLALTPRVAPAGDARFWAEPSPLGEPPERWARAVADALAPWGEARVGLGAWAALAFAAAREGALHGTPAALDRAPLDALELDPEAIDTLRTLGVRDVGALKRLDPVALGVRLGPAVAAARRRATGEDPRIPWTPRADDAPHVELALDDELDQLEPLLFLLRPALARLLRAPVGRGEGVTALRLRLDRERGAPLTHAIRTAHPIGDPSTLLELVRARLEAQPDPTGDGDARDLLTGFAITALERAPLGDRTGDLFGEAARDPAAREVALARLEGRFGDEALARATRVEHASPVARAAWTQGEPLRGPSHPWRVHDPPAPMRGDTVHLLGRPRRVVRRARVERALAPWWDDGVVRVERLAWAELEGPILVLLRERRDSSPPRWEAIAWVD
ncbi:MAG: hypothetical protein VYE22_32475 [Myxococcota bacterium]|nr:hypothetical protein [Myxococcota bacterium]